MSSNLSLLLFFLIACLHLSCKSQPLYNTFELGSGINYDLEEADVVIELGSQLKEISGIAFHKTTDAIYAVNDEKGSLYALDKRNGNILAQYDFGGEGDYEGLEINGNLVYIVESNGEVIVFDLIKKKRIEKLKNNLNDNNDIEGIGLGEEGDLLLLCKGKSLKGDRQEDIKHIYKIPNTGDGPVQKYLGIDIKAGIAQLEYTTPLEPSWLENIVFKDRINRFAPSGLATHPETKEKYIISSRGSLLMVINSSNEINHIQLLNPGLHNQPEGITFDIDNKMYISNEGGDGKAKIFIYNSK